MNLAIRLNVSQFELETFWANLEQVSESSVWVEHPKDTKVSRAHLHGLLWGYRGTVETLKNWIMASIRKSREIAAGGHVIQSNNEPKKLPRTDWAFKQTYKKNGKQIPVDWLFPIYMLKGKFRIVHSHGVDDVEKKEQEWKNAWVEKPGQELHQTTMLDVVAPADKKMTRWEMLQNVKTRLAFYERDVTDDDVITEIINVFRYQKEIVSRYKIRDMYDSYMMYQEDNAAFKQQLKNLCIKV